MSDFDEGKRSCRRKLERHNNRRRRKPADSKETVETEAQQALSFDDGGGCDNETGKGIYNFKLVVVILIFLVIKEQSTTCMHVVGPSVFVSPCY